jgi:NADH-quinone oxidoreductase subunit L
MTSDANVFVMGEDIGSYGGIFGATGGLLEKFGKDRIMDTPISETAFIGAATGAAAAGFIPFGKFVSSDGKTLISEFDWQFSIAPVALGIAGILTAMWLYKKQNSKPDTIASSLNAWYKAAYHTFYMDELYLFITKKILFNVVGRPAAWFDKNVVDAMVNATGNTTQTMSEKIKGFQSGKVQDYAIYFLAGAIALAVCGIYIWM